MFSSDLFSEGVSSQLTESILKDTCLSFVLQDYYSMMDSDGPRSLNGLALHDNYQDTNYAYEATEEQRRNARMSSLDDFWKMHRKSLDDPDAFWSEASESLYWKIPVPKQNVCRYNFDVHKGKIFIEWMKGAMTNICYNALDRNVEKGHGEQIAYFWEGNDPLDSDKITYRELLRRVCKFANILKSKGVKKGDMVAMYMPMILELVISMFACARIGAVHSVVFGGYSAEALADRVLDGNCKVIVTADGVFRGTKLIELKNIVDKTVKICKERNHIISSVIVVNHQMRLSSTRKYLKEGSAGEKLVHGCNIGVSWNESIDCWWDKEMEESPDVCDPVWLDAEHTLFTLYTSGSTGSPKGCVHTTGAYMVYGAVSFKLIFDYYPGDVFFCTGDIGWLTGHTYIVYGSLLNTATCILYEGVPAYPDPGRYWSIVEKYAVTQFYTAPTAIRTLMKFDNSFVTRHDRSSIRLLGSVGEPINRDAWFWYHGIVGEGRVPIVDTYWQTETGGFLMTPVPFCTPLKPGCAALPFFGVEPELVDENGKVVEGPGKGYLVIKRPWPAIMRTVFKNQQRFEDAYFKKFPGYYFTGDGCRRDENGFYWITGRVDDMLNVSGHLLSTSEVESALLGNRNVAETAVVPHFHPIKGECLYCFVVLKDGCSFDDKIVQELKQQVVNIIGPFARPEYFHPASSLPKTRSGKTVRRILRKVAANDRDIGDLSTLLDENVVDELFESKNSLKLNK
ncbi:acetyl-coenzyme A synthetase, cytoplasmic-like [Parasteatoda tepidariorum]|uniref:acetyl-coenzyme A synthetase, cytoplasmic-like n=1 Tax=Parasteatoda tepidariorum TaxID=114398 RepID=UPI001C72989B|nr:acetyl-coenzyme A synthetase, cytoplasmic-like [Parasteatoda tepidariorum]